MPDWIKQVYVAVGSNLRIDAKNFNVQLRHSPYNNMSYWNLSLQPMGKISLQTFILSPWAQYESVESEMIRHMKELKVFI